MYHVPWLTDGYTVSVSDLQGTRRRKAVGGMRLDLASGCALIPLRCPPPPTPPRST